MTNVTVAIENVASTIASETKAFRSALVSSENRSTPFARSVLATVVSGLSTMALIESNILHAYGNPKNAKGKAIAKVSGLRDCVGGQAMYQTWKSVQSIVDCIDGDAPTDVAQDDGSTVSVGSGSIRKAVVGFILEASGAPKNLRQLSLFIGEALKTHNALTLPANDEAEADNAANATPDATPVATVSLVDRVTATLLAYNASSADERDAAYEAICLLFEAVDADTKARADVDAKETVDA